jgi:acyl-[acyl-carrier-protein] desaturase
VPTPSLSDAAFLAELAPAAERLYERHLETTREWFPHELVPYSQARDFEPGEVWDESEVPMDPAVRSSLLVNLLTEDNLPFYFQVITRMFGADDVWGEWNRRWVAEEGRHSIVIRDYLTATRSLDPWELERNRMHQVQAGFHGETLPNAANGFAYVALQELATRISHWNTGDRLADPRGKEVMSRVAKDENFHYLFYRDLVAAGLEVDPSTTVEAIAHQVDVFEMPGTGIAGFRAHAQAIANAGIYDLVIHHDKILVPCVLRHWKVDAIEGLSAAAEAAREHLFAQMARLKKVGAHLAEKREARQAALAS